MFAPGVSGNPAGRTSKKKRLDAEAERLTVVFRSTHRRDPTHAEQMLIRSAVTIFHRLQREPPKNSLNVNRLSNTFSRHLRRLGLVTKPRAQSSADALSKSGRQILDGGAK
jgi:hypothetical protein